MRFTRTIRVVAVAVVLTAAAISVPEALAQTSPRPGSATPQWFVSLGGAAMTPLHGDNEPEGGVVLAAIGFTDHRRVRVEAEVTRRARSASYTDNDVFLYGGLTGVHGRAGRITRGRETTDWTVGVNLIGRTGQGVVSLFGVPVWCCTGNSCGPTEP